MDYTLEVVGAGEALALYYQGITEHFVHQIMTNSVADPGGALGGRAPPPPRPSKVGPATPQTLCSIGAYSGCAP